MSRAQEDAYRAHTDHELNAYQARLDAKLRKLAYPPQRKVVQSRRRLDSLPEIQQTISQLKTNEKIKNAKLCIPYNTSQYKYHIYIG